MGKAAAKELEELQKAADSGDEVAASWLWTRSGTLTELAQYQPLQEEDKVIPCEENLCESSDDDSDASSESLQDSWSPWRLRKELQPVAACKIQSIQRARAARKLVGKLLASKEDLRRSGTSQWKPADNAGRRLEGYLARADNIDLAKPGQPVPCLLYTSPSPRDS